METTIQELEDAKAIRALVTITEARVHSGKAAAIGWTPELSRVLNDAFGEAPAAGESITEGDLARQALLVLAEDPEEATAIAALIQGPPPMAFGVATTVAVVTAALVVLQTHGIFERDKDGRYRFKVEKKPTSDALLRPLVQKILEFLSGGTGGKR